MVCPRDKCTVDESVVCASTLKKQMGGWMEKAKGREEKRKAKMKKGETI
jgi:hypothetical protein